MTLNRVLSVFIAGSALISCGFKGPKVEEQSSSKIDGPDFESSSNVFHFVNDGTKLTAGDKDHKYDGTLILWNENANPALISQVINLSIQGKTYKNAYFEILSQLDLITTSQSKERTNLIALEKLSDRTLLELKAYEKQSSSLLATANLWANNQVAPGKTIQFHNYCDMNLLEFAVNPFLYQNTFSKTPVASSLCADYYASLALFSGPTCTTVSSTDVGNYFRCFWEEGVLKRFSFSTGNERDFLDNLSDFLNLLTKKTPNTQILKFGKLGDRFKIKPLSSSLIMAKYVPDSGSKEFLLQGILNPSFKYFTSMQQKRTASDNSKYSFNDRLFNFHLIKDEKNVPSLKTEDSADLTQLQIENHDVFGTQIIIDDPILEKIQQSKKTITSYDEKISSIKAEASKPFDDSMHKDTEAAKMIIDNNLAHTMISQISLDMLADENAVKVEIKFPLTPQNTPQTIVGCFDWSSGKSDTCTSNGVVPTSQEAKLTFNKSSGQILFTYRLKEPAQVGFNAIQKDPSFQKIPTSQLKDKTLWMELYPRKFKTHLDIITGTVKILENEQIIFQGSLSFATRISQ